MAKYLLTGTAGFIGSRVAQMLLERGDDVIGIDNLNDAYDVRFKIYRLKQLLEQPNFKFYPLDIADREAIKTLDEHLHQTDAVFNLAARAGVRASIENPWVFFETNQVGTLNLLELCRNYGIPKFILASTSSIYGADAPQPTPETAESSQPMQPYAASKKGAEVLCYAYHHLYGVDVTIFRYFTVYGPSGRPDMAMFRFSQWIAEEKPVHLYGDGSQSRGFTYIDDIARGTIMGLKNLGYEIINLGGHQIISINDLIQKMEECLGMKAKVIHHPAHPADMLGNLANVEKAKTLLSWEAQISLDEGISRTISWYLSQREWAREIITW